MESSSDSRRCRRRRSRVSPITRTAGSVTDPSLERTVAIFAVMSAENIMTSGRLSRGGPTAGGSSSQCYPSLLWPSISCGYSSLLFPNDVPKNHLKKVRGGGLALRDSQWQEASDHCGDSDVVADLGDLVNVFVALGRLLSYHRW